MRHLTSILLLFAASVTQSFAQELKIPRWEKFVKVTTEGVNLRKAPSTTSPKLMARDQGVFGYEFSWKPENEYETYHFSEYENILPVIDETEQWYCLYFSSIAIGRMTDCFEVWIMKKYCQEIKPISISKNDYGWCELEEVKGSNNYLIGAYYLGSAAREPFARFGKKVGDYFVLAGFDDGMRFINNYCTGETAMEREFDIDKMKEADMERFVKSQKNASNYDIWVKFAGKEQPRLFVIDANYRHPVTTIPFISRTASNTTANSVQEFRNSDSKDEFMTLGDSEKNKKDIGSFDIKKTSKSENSQSTNDDDVKIFDVVERMPQYPGGSTAMSNYLSSNVKYPPTAEKNRIQGRVLLSFIVERDGSLTDIRVIKSVDPLLDKEAMRVIKSMPKWIPGKHNGSAVRVKYTIPVTFRLK